MKSLCISIGPEWPLAEAEFKRVGLNVERFDAIVEDNRVLAFNKSVMACMKKAITIRSEGNLEDTLSGKDNYKETRIVDDLLLFEDDVVFDVNNLPVLATPNGFMTLHLGCNILGMDITKWQMPTAHSQHLAKLHNCFQSHATLYSAECVKFIIDNFPFVTDQYKTEGCLIFDEWLRLNVLNQGRSYVMKPMIAYQRPRHSEIWNRFGDYTYCHIEGNKWLKRNL